MSRDSGDNVAVDFVWGNMPVQPNDDRPSWARLSASSPHIIPATEWDSYPNNNVPEGGRTLNNGNSLYWPELWILCDGSPKNMPTLSQVVNYMLEAGVNPNVLVDFTFSGGQNKWDWQGGEPNWDGSIFYSYVPKNELFDVDWDGSPIYGSSLNNKVFGGDPIAGNLVSTNPESPENNAIYVFSNDPNKNTLNWWWS